MTLAHYHLIFPGRPQTWSRPRCNGKIFFDPKLKNRKMLAAWIKPQIASTIKGAVKIEIIAFYKSPTKKKIGEWKLTRADLDNVSKNLLDALTNVAYEDDAQVVFLTAQKKWGTTDETHIFITEL